VAYEEANGKLAFGLCGLTPAQFSRLTPAEFFQIAQAKIEQRNEEWRFQDVLNGVQCSLLANINRSSSTRPYAVEDFRVMKDKEKKQTPEEIMATFKAMEARNGV